MAAKRVFVPLVPDHCWRCARVMDLVIGDGPVIVCRACLFELGHAARDPMSVDAEERDVLRDAHADVVRLGEKVNGKAVWEWLA